MQKNEGIILCVVPDHTLLRIENVNLFESSNESVDSFLFLFWGTEIKACSDWKKKKNPRYFKCVKSLSVQLFSDINLWLTTVGFWELVT